MLSRRVVVRGNVCTRYKIQKEDSSNMLKGDECLRAADVPLHAHFPATPVTAPSQGKVGPHEGSFSRHALPTLSLLVVNVSPIPC